jgi:hypothetical protein
MRLYLPVFPGQHPDTRNTRPTYVVENIENLTAQAAGIMTLPPRLDWTPVRSYNISDIYERLRFYEIVLTEAHSEDDIEEYINGEELTKLWEQLHIPPRVRYAWESVHPELGLKKYG